MDKQFRNSETEAIFTGVNSKKTRKFLPLELHDNARRKMAIIAAAQTLESLMLIPGNKFHAVGGDRKHEYALWINKQYRVCFKWNGTAAYELEITDYH